MNDKYLWVPIITFIIMSFGIFWMLVLSSTSYTVNIDDDVVKVAEELSKFSNESVSVTINNNYYDGDTACVKGCVAMFEQLAGDSNTISMDGVRRSDCKDMCDS